MFPVLETKRLMLREIRKEDVPEIYACFSDPQVTRFYGQEPFTSIDQAAQLVDFFAKNCSERRGIRWGIERKGIKGLIGTAGFNSWAPSHKRAEIGYELYPRYWQHGYAGEAVSRIISYGFDDLQLNRIGAVVFIENHSSNELLKKLGFKKEGVLRDYMQQNGSSYNKNVYSLLKGIRTREGGEAESSLNKSFNYTKEI